MQDECSCKMCRVIPERLLQRNRGCSFLSYREKIRWTLLTHLQSHNILTGSGLIQMVHIKCIGAPVKHKSILLIQRAICKRPENCYAHKVHKCTSTHSNISLYHWFKEVCIKGLKTANKVQGIVSSIMLLVISTKGCHLHTWGEETIIHITSQGTLRQGRIWFLLRYIKVLRACYCSIVVLHQWDADGRFLRLSFLFPGE